MSLYGGDARHDVHHVHDRDHALVKCVCVKPDRYSYLSIFATLRAVISFKTLLQFISRRRC